MTNYSMFALMCAAGYVLLLIMHAYATDLQEYNTQKNPKQVQACTSREFRNRIVFLNTDILYNTKSFALYMFFSETRKSNYLQRLTTTSVRRKISSIRFSVKRISYLKHVVVMRCPTNY